MSEQTPQDLKDNPFAALFPSVKDAEKFSKSSPHIGISREEGLPGQHQEDDVEMQQNSIDAGQETTIDEEMEESDIEQQKDFLVERIFLLVDSVNAQKESRGNGNNLPSFSTVLESDETGPLCEVIEQLIFNRLLLQNPENYVKKRTENSNAEEDCENAAKEDRPLVYLLQSFSRILHEEKYVSPQLLPIVVQCRLLIVRNISTALISPELFSVLSKEQAEVHHQFYEILASNDCMLADSPPRICLYEVADYITLSEPQLMAIAFDPMLKILSEGLKLVDLLDGGLCVHMEVFGALAGYPSLACLAVEYRAKNLVATVAQAQTKTLVEILLGKSCLVPDLRTKSFLFFDEVRRLGPTQIENEEFHLHTKTSGFHFQLLTVTKLLLKHDSSRHKLLQWIGEFIAKYDYLSKMWVHEQSDVFMDVFGPDAMFLNLSALLMRLCLPFCSDKTITEDFDGQDDSRQTPKLLKINASYTYATGQRDAAERGVHGVNLHKDTCLQSVSDGATLNVTLADSYKFITECFFLAHRAIYIGVHGLIKKFYRLSRNLSREEDVYRQIQTSGADSDDMAARVVTRFETGLRIYLNMKGALTEPTFLQNCVRFYGTTSQYLNHIAMTDNMEHLVPVTLPLPDDENVPRSLYYVPEYIIENMTDMIIFLQRFARISTYLLDPFLHDFLLTVTIYMGNKSRMSNPHLRASLAEVLQILMPLSEQDGSPVGNRVEIFNQFPHMDFLTVATLQLFVDIEFTGDPNQFEQKFHYRQPLYKILKYLWKREISNATIKEQVKKSIENIDDATHPLFLQFINLLLNDSIYLIDEAMGFLAQIKTLERAKAAGEWEELNQREKMEKEAELKQLGMLAKYHNMLSNDTVDTLVYLTKASEVKDLFSHPSLADRVAAMLDDFLLKLVGPKMGALRVKDFSVFEFKPKTLVIDFSRIYIHLCQREDFCRAISRDGRSYGPKLFPMACQVIRRIGNEEIRDQMMEVSERIKIISVQEEEEEEMFMDAPDDFYDALMSTLMRDPVILPSSKQVVDRSTIHRHLMSDPTDPFNRNPLTMQDVIPNTDLKSKIQEWIKEKQKSKAGGS